MFLYLTQNFEKMAEAGHESEFARLMFAMESIPDLFSDVPDAKGFFLGKLREKMASSIAAEYITRFKLTLEKDATIQKQKTILEKKAFLENELKIRLF